MDDKAAAPPPSFDDMADGVCLTSEGRILSLNPAAEKILGVAAADALGSDLCGLLCSRIATSARADCGKDCALRGPACPERGVAVEGRYEHRAFDWHDLTIDRIESVLRLRVLCLRAALRPDPTQPDVRVTIIEDVGGRAAPERTREDWRRLIDLIDRRLEAAGRIRYAR